MDSSSFDRLTRFFAAALSRRALGGALLGVVAGLAGLTDGAAATCPKSRKRCRSRCIPRRACCTKADCPRGSGKVCRRGRCVCPPSKQRCRTRCIPKAACCQKCPPGHVCRQARCCIGSSAALTAALAPGGPTVIRLCPGTTYPGRFYIGSNRTVTLLGAGAGSTVLSGDGTGEVLSADLNATATLQDLQVTNGRAGVGAGIFNQGVLTLRRCLVTGNRATIVGGGITNNSSSARLTLDSSLVTNNVAQRGGGIHNNLALLMLQGTSQVAGNVATEVGGGINIEGVSSRVVLEGSTLITDNQANPGNPASGGGIYNLPTNSGTVNFAGSARVFGNQPNQCTNVSCPS